MISNCNIEAGRRFRSGAADMVWLRRTDHSYYGELSSAWWWRNLLRPVGFLIELVGWILLQLASYLQTGKWLHAGWVHVGHCFEFSPEGQKKQKRIPPIVYRGVVRHIADWVECSEYRSGAEISR